MNSERLEEIREFLNQPDDVYEAAPGIALELLKAVDELRSALIELEDLCKRNEELERNLRRTGGALMQAWEAITYALNEWFDRVYPPDVFVGGPTADSGVHEVREVVKRLREALEEKVEINE